MIGSDLTDLSLEPDDSGSTMTGHSDFGVVVHQALAQLETAANAVDYKPKYPPTSGDILKLLSGPKLDNGLWLPDKPGWNCRFMLRWATRNQGGNRPFVSVPG